MGGKRRSAIARMITRPAGRFQHPGQIHMVTPSRGAAPGAPLTAARWQTSCVEPTSVVIVPHTHWDREWYEPFEGFRKRLVAMMDTLLDLLDRGFPHFHLDGQTAMIDDYLEVRPEREADLRTLAAEGRLSVGPWFTQMDEFLTSGESHIRNLEVGLARARDLGAAPPVGYLPDQFGHIGQMPQILSLGGLDRVVVWRGGPPAPPPAPLWGGGAGGGP